MLVFISSLLALAALGGAGWGLEHTLIATTMLVVGLFAVLSWDSTFPDRRDVLVLAPLPVRASTLFLAKDGFQKIPFTCSYLPGRSLFHMAFLGALGLMALIGRGVDFERRALDDPVLYARLMGVLGSAVVLARWRTVAVAASEETIVQFEELPDPAIMSLGLHGK